MHEYLNALAQGAKLSPGTYNDVVAKLHQYTGLSESYIRQSNLRVPYWRYETELFRNNGVMLGRFDARFTSYNLDRIGDRPDFDSTDASMDAAFVSAGNYYMRQVLGYKRRSSIVRWQTSFAQWDWKHNGGLPTQYRARLSYARWFTIQT